MSPCDLGNGVASVNAFGMHPNMDQWERDLEAWNKAVESLKKHNSMIESAMGEYVKREGGLDQVPEQYRAKVWAKSYEDGHSGGWSEVYCQLQGLVEIFVS